MRPGILVPIGDEAGYFGTHWRWGRVFSLLK